MEEREKKSRVGEANMVFPRILCYGCISQGSGQDIDNNKTPRFSLAQSQSRPFDISVPPPPARCSDAPLSPDLRHENAPSSSFHHLKQYTRDDCALCGLHLNCLVS